VYMNAVSRGYFNVLSIPVMEGRDFTSRDDGDDKLVAIVNETLARRISRRSSKGGTAVGELLRMTDGSTIEVVGVAQDVKYESFDEEPKAFLYRPLPQQPAASVTFLVRTPPHPEATPDLQALIGEVDRSLVVYNIGSLEQRIGLNVLPNRAAATVGGVLGALALLLSAVGIYGAACFITAERGREIAIRMALGAQPTAVMNVVSGEAAAFIGVGALLGLGAAVALTSLLRRFLYSIPSIDAAAFGGIALLLVGVAFLAFYAPARAACRANPASILKA
jgi:ABC-type antimicrobial peptide transport system permease subunit